MKAGIFIILIILTSKTFGQQMVIEYGVNYNVQLYALMPWKAGIVYDFGSSIYYLEKIETMWGEPETNMGWKVTQFGTTTPTLTVIGNLSGTFDNTHPNSWHTITINSGTEITGKVAFLIESETNSNNCYIDFEVNNPNGGWMYKSTDGLWYQYNEMFGAGVNAIKVTVNTINPLPVELNNFYSKLTDGKIHLFWSTATEVNNYGFEIERKSLQSDWFKIGFIRGHANSNSPKEYTFIDENPLAGNLQYRLKQIDTDGEYEYSPAVEVYLEVPADFSVKQNFPNPFNPTTKIEFLIPSDNRVKIIVYDVLGMEAAIIIDEHRQAGRHIVEFNAGNLSSGIYFYKVVSGNYSEIKKMTLLR
ncbi:MAG: T9SS type A sorting domain-containing protein [Ignavibacteriales bacterium]|nr:T9SS type A sorting domain-containing protein [Ignavibacteriales bacterium]MCF8438541.1 T9SS type A sorting domain-containing protein [Ignavibacteriales bacterium]